MKPQSVPGEDECLWMVVFVGRALSAGPHIHLLHSQGWLAWNVGEKDTSGMLLGESASVMVSHSSLWDVAATVGAWNGEYTSEWQWRCCEGLQQCEVNSKYSCCVHMTRSRTRDSEQVKLPFWLQMGFEADKTDVTDKMRPQCSFMMCSLSMRGLLPHVSADLRRCFREPKNCPWSHCCRYEVAC